MKPVIPCLAFTDNAEEAVSFYIDLFAEVFGESGEIARSHFVQAEIDAVRDIRGLPPERLPGPAGAVKTIRFQLNGLELLAFNGGVSFGKFHESYSLYVSCQTQAQIDRLWDALAAGGRELPCGWVTDRFGISWQIVPDFILAINEQGDRASTEQMNVALIGMNKVDLAKMREVSRP